MPIEDNWREQGLPTSFPETGATTRCDDVEGILSAGILRDWPNPPAAYRELPTVNLLFSQQLSSP
jgi:hypothetical protein